jgi:cell division GTPase FtsZ
MDLLILNDDACDADEAQLESWVGTKRLVVLALALEDPHGVQLASDIGAWARKRGALVLAWAHHPLASPEMKFIGPLDTAMDHLGAQVDVLIELAPEESWRVLSKRLPPQEGGPYLEAVLAAMAWTIEDLCALVGRFPMDDALRELRTVLPGHYPGRISPKVRGRIGVGWAKDNESVKTAIQRAIRSPHLGDPGIRAAWEILVIVSGGAGRGKDLARRVGKEVSWVSQGGSDVVFGRVPGTSRRMGITIIATRALPPGRVPTDPPSRTIAGASLHHGRGGSFSSTG